MPQPQDFIKLSLATPDRDYRPYLETMAGIKRISVTKYIQSLIDADWERNATIYEQAQALASSIEH